ASCDFDIIIPNVITPNDDMYNEAFVIQYLERHPNSSLEIRNRWGKVVYESGDYKNDWDGEDHADGVYFYELNLQNGENFSGTLTIIR
ncbi:MAG: gliding motility-associated C-terminal domain-containing protein, partial [Bacteroidia bacterium]|nr:gliding motility-associated C-terminal domain-containing protein [Bacteroidia bacterium]